MGRSVDNLLRAGLIFLAVIFGSSAPPAADAARHADAAEIDPQQVKAAYLYNFSLFMEWPGEQEYSGPVRLCVLGGEQFGDMLASTLRGRQTRGRPIEVRHSTWPQDLGACHIVYIGALPAKEQPAAAQFFSSQPVLLVADAPGMADKGSAINFYMENNRVRFEVNLETVHKAGYSISSRMLQVARIVGERGGDQ